MRRFRAALLALGLVLIAAAAGAGTLAERARGTLDHDLRLAGASRVTALDDYAERARAVTLVASHSDAFADFYEAGGTREQRIRGEVGEEGLMPAVHLALSDLGVLFPNDVGAAGFIDRNGAENAVVVRGRDVDPDELSKDRSDLPFFDRAFELPFEKVYQSAPYPSAETDEWVVSFAAKVARSADVSPALIHFDVPVESIRLALYSEDPSYRVRVVDLLDGRVIIDSKHPQDVDAPLGQPDDRSLRWVQTAADGLAHSESGQRHVVELARATANVATSWAVVVSVEEPTGLWAAPTAPGPVSLLVAGVVLLALSVVGYVRHGRQMHRAARRDELTHLHNRMAVREIADSVLVRERSLAVILFDLDRFKHVNDSLGHHAGDHLLAVIASRLAEVVRDADDVVARLGGDEFVVLARGLHDMAAVRSMCERIAVPSPSRSPSTASTSPSGRASASRWRPTTVATSASSCRAPTSRCTTPSAGAPGGRSTATTWLAATVTSSSWTPTCAGRWTRGRWRSTSSPASRSTPAGWSAPRRWCAGSTRRAASCSPASSCRSPRPPAPSRRSPAWCSRSRSTWSPSGGQRPRRAGLGQRLRARRQRPGLRRAGRRRARCP